MFERIPEFLRRRRLDRKLTQDELAELSGLSTSQISRLESGTQDAKLSILSQLLEALDLTFGEFSARYLALLEELEPEEHPPKKEELEDMAKTFEDVLAPLRPMLGTLPPGLNGVQLDFPRHWIYILPKGPSGDASEPRGTEP